MLRNFIASLMLIVLNSLASFGQSSYFNDNSTAWASTTSSVAFRPFVENLNDESNCCQDQNWSAGQPCDRRTVQWLKPWTCDALQMQPFEPVPHCGRRVGNLWCPDVVAEAEAEEANGGASEGNSNGNAADGSNLETEGQAGANGQADSNGAEKGAEAEETEEADDASDLSPWMQSIHCRNRCRYERFNTRGDRLYGWLQMGYTQNFASPNDRINFGNKFNWRSNDFRLNQF